MGHDAVRLYARSMREGVFSTYNIRCMFVGHYGVGKTTLVNGILGRKDVRITSTDGIDVFIGQCYVDRKRGHWITEGKGTILS